MKNQNEIKKEIKICEDKIKHYRDCKDKKGETREINKLRKYRMVLVYLTTNPSEPSLLSQQSNLKTIIKSKRSQYEIWKKNNPILGNERKKRRHFNQEMGLTQMRRQLRVINQILN